MISPRVLFVAQRYSAMLLAPMVLVHLIVIVLAVRNGLSADEILGRTRDNAIWFWFYLLFVVAASVHAPIGVRNILNEWTSLSARSIAIFCVLLAVVLLGTGMRAVVAVT